MELLNNSKEMKTVVETFVIEETAELIYDNEKLEKWNELVGELGLTGQAKIVAPNKSPIPFMHLKSSMMNVFRTLCPREIRVEDYSITPIPVEILDLVALSKREKYFDNIFIHYDDKSPDPVCIGIKGDYYTYNRNYSTLKKGLTYAEAVEEKQKNPEVYNYNHEKLEYYLLGKWADVKHSFEELKKMATERFLSQKRNEITKYIRDYQRELEDLETIAFNQFN